MRLSYHELKSLQLSQVGFNVQSSNYSFLFINTQEAFTAESSEGV